MRGEGWVNAYLAWLTGLQRAKGLMEPRVLEIPERCAALEAPQADGKGERSCHFDIMHKGPHSWALPVPVAVVNVAEATITVTEGDPWAISCICNHEAHSHDYCTGNNCTFDEKKEVN